MVKELTEEELAELILSNFEMTGDELFDYLEIPLKYRSDFLISVLTYKPFKIIRKSGVLE